MPRQLPKTSTKTTVFIHLSDAGNSISLASTSIPPSNITTRTHLLHATDAIEQARELLYPRDTENQDSQNNQLPLPQAPAEGQLPNAQ